MTPQAKPLLRHGDLVRLAPFEETAQVFLCEPVGEKIRLGLIFQQSKRAETFYLSPEELSQRVKVIPSLREQFAQGNLLPQKPFLLYAEALRMRLAYTFDPHYAVSVTQVDLLPHQVDAVYKHILPLPKVRFLLTDDPGLGKTIMAGLLMKELKVRGVVRRVLLVVPAHLQDQWCREMRDWFREEFTQIDRGLAEQLRSDDFLERNPQLITSLDFAKREPYPQLLSRRRWDLVIFDEAHELSAAKYGREEKRTQRYELGAALARATTHLLLLTATPHKGDHFAYFKLIELLAPYLFADEWHLLETSRAQGQLPFVLRRSKEQAKDLLGNPLFKKREVSSLKVALSSEEAKLYEAVTAYVKKWYGRVAAAKDRRSRNIGLALVVLQRRLASSLTAIGESLKRRRAKLLTLLDRWEAVRDTEYELPTDAPDEEPEDYTAQERERFEEQREGLTAAESPEELRDEIRHLDRLIQLAQQAARVSQEAKTEQLRGLVERHLKNDSDEKLLVFTEFKDTLYGLIKRFREWGYETATIHGEMTLSERIEQERRFRAPDVQVMVATEAAGEGLNLQFCRLMVNYDLPWNPNRLEQRMGRIHRYGQKRDCFVYNMLYHQTREGQVLDTLLEKLNEMRQQLGDSVYDVVGTLLEGVKLEQLVMQAVLKDSPQEVEVTFTRDLEQAFQQYRRALEESALASHHIDHMAILQEDTRSLEMRLVPWDVERFTREALGLIGGTMQADKKDKGVWKVAVPREFAKKFHLPDSLVRGLRVAFERKVIKEAETLPELLAPGHPLFEALCEHFLQGKEKPLRTLLLDPKGRSGSLWFYCAQVLDGENQTAREQLLTFFYDSASAEVRAVDPRVLWEFEGAEPDATIPQHFIEGLTQAQEAIRSEVARYTDRVFEEAKARRERDTRIKRDYLERSFNTLMAESNRKLLDYQKRLDAGEDMRLVIEEEEKHLKALVREKTERLKALEREMALVRLEPELIAVALVVPKGTFTEQAAAALADEELKKRIERTAMAVAMSYERAQGRTPQDVSLEFRGYDILSQGPDETRHIEVKGFQTTGELQLTLHEWQMAQRLGDKYWVYAVENALTSPQLTRIQNPAEKLPAPEEILRTVKVVFADWKKAVESEN